MFADAARFMREGSRQLPCYLHHTQESNGRPDCSITSTRRVSPSRTACVRENEELTDSPCAEVIASALTLSCRAAFLCSLFILVFSIPDILALRFVRILRRGKSWNELFTSWLFSSLSASRVRSCLNYRVWTTTLQTMRYPLSIFLARSIHPHRILPLRKSDPHTLNPPLA